MAEIILDIGCSHEDLTTKVICLSGFPSPWDKVAVLLEKIKMFQPGLR